ncbi:phosphodiesterase [Marinimicrococcus flavescens]|uniref:Phosphodiesterase n=1 Tax=Marinimicrococcus flavescens TaxID=3031815 RepID=A0AAP3XRH3_9PROT|nr:phosphodiesterase [Marinimicrococcus flavescens]
MLIAQITDLHVCPPGQLAFGVVDTAAALARTVDALLRLAPRPDLVLVTGDLAFDGQPAEYREIARQLGRLPMPVYAIPGNHDERGAWREVLGSRFSPAEHPTFIQYVVDLGPLRLVALDSIVPGSPAGELCQERLDWLETQLAQGAGKPALVMLHHPPTALGVRFMDATSCAGGERLKAVIERHPEVERVLCGHLHRPVTLRWAGTILSVAPGTAHQIPLEMREEGPAGYNLEPPAFHLHCLVEGSGLVTHQVYLQSFAGTFPFTPRG